LEGLARYPLLTYRAGTEERLHVDNAFAAAGLKPNIVLTAEAAALAACARLGLGVAIVCGWEATEHASKELRILDASRIFTNISLLAAFRCGKILCDFERQYTRLLLPDMNLDALQHTLLFREEPSYVPTFTI
jgi:LysR family cys regulon transcriptional activator